MVSTTLEDYRSKFSNIPAEGSAKVKLIQKPDLSKKGPQGSTEFSVDGIDKKSKAIAMVNVEDSVARQHQPLRVGTQFRSAVTAISGNSSRD